MSQDNIFITPSFRACIADFGLSSIITPLSSIRFTNSSKRTQGVTIRYQAPELHRGGENDLRSDIYAFACVVYEVRAFEVRGGFGKLVNTTPDIDRKAAIPGIIHGWRGDSGSARGTAAFQTSFMLGRPLGPAPELLGIAARLTSDGLSSGKATKTESALDWDEKFTAKFRRNLQGPGSWVAFERTIFGHCENPFVSEMSRFLQSEAVEEDSPYSPETASESSDEEEWQDNDAQSEAVEDSPYSSVAASETSDEEDLQNNAKAALLRMRSLAGLNRPLRRMPSNETYFTCATHFTVPDGKGGFTKLRA
ncbi:hypothetical protein FB45DRAFT_878363 [Roridomyces roridus]|uniref:Protein kinase domain-containing protein n=1 Tax=Roridomyces roridus TaxID=1738132 RepID=A0AAD7B199_9AGAR|nr:hypothetical protein FB45DRAFT_878363 [Roridomyces roridus]